MRNFLRKLVTAPENKNHQKRTKPTGSKKHAGPDAILSLDTESEIYNRKDLRYVVNELRKIENSSTTRNLILGRHKEWLASILRTETRENGRVDSRTHVKERFRQTLQNSGITSGVICELGSPNKSFKEDFPNFEFEFLSLYPRTDRDDVTVADITQCHHVPSNKFDAIFSLGVLEHVSEPQEAAKQIYRILKPGGLSFHVAPFSYFYHGSPSDYWRYTPDAMAALFSEMRPIVREFYGANRRRDNRGSKFNRVDRDGGADFAVDAFGGWRENWQTIFGGVKDEKYLSEIRLRAKHQLIVNLLDVLQCDTETTEVKTEHLQLVSQSIRNFRIDHKQRITPSRNNGIEYSTEEVKNIWESKTLMNIKPSYSRYVMAGQIGIK